MEKFNRKFYEKESVLIEHLIATCEEALKLESYDILTLFFWKVLIDVLCDMIKVYNLNYDNFLIRFENWKKNKKI